LAQALTAIEHELFLSLHEEELLGIEWKKKNKHIRAPNVVSMINWFNRVSLSGKSPVNQHRQPTGSKPKFFWESQQKREE
jgi:hypothetical protein